MAKFIIEHGGNVEVVDDNGFNALLWATIIDNQEEKIKVIKLLLENGVNIKQIGSDGHNVLSLLSLTKSKEEILLEVIKQGAEIDQNESIFHQVYEYIEKAKFKNIDFILENGIFKSEKNREKLRALRLTLLF
jgi:ankyrin repeat protein